MTVAKLVTAPAGIVNLICVSLTTVKIGAVTVPNLTVLVPVNPLPVRVICTPITAEAGDGEPVILGARVAATLNVGAGVGVAEALGCGVATDFVTTTALVTKRV